MEKKVNQQIAKLRKERKITQEQLAKAVGVTNQSVSKWEKGICCPDIQLLPEIAEFFGVCIDELFGNQKVEKNQVFWKEPMEKKVLSETVFLQYEEKISNKTAEPEDYYYYAEMLDKCSLDYIIRAKKWYQKCMDLTKDTQTEAFRRAQKKLISLRCRMREREMVIQECENARENNPEDWWNGYLLAFACKESGKIVQAHKAMEETLLHFQNSELYELAGDICRELGLYEDAIEHWSRAFAMDGSSCSPLYAKAYLLEKMEEYEKAMQSWEAVIRWRHENRQDDNHELDWPLLKLEELKKLAD